MKAFQKNIFRTIGKSKGRYFAIMAIIALGVGFFSGLKVTKPSMIERAIDFYEDTNFYDMRLLSTYGFTSDEVDEISEISDVDMAEGSFSVDFLYVSDEGTEDVLKAITIPQDINKVDLTEGRMPEKENECLIDENQFGADMIGKEITIDVSNSTDIKDSFKYEKYTVVGVVDSPLYINIERGTTSLGNGKITGFVYIPSEGMEYEYFTEVYVKCDSSHETYSEEYENYIENITPHIEDELEKIADKRYRELEEEIEDEIALMLSAGLSLEEIEGMDIPELEAPEVYVLDRSTNTGYMCYDNDTNIIDGVARVFPIFFFLIAALVCSTTMTRMIDDERGQIGTLRALGYTNSAIIWKYVVYSGSAGIIGCLVGFFLGCKVFPYVVNEAYKMLYQYGDEIKFYFAPKYLVITMAVSLICSMGTAFLACRNELRCMPSELIRPKAPAAGKRILLEKIKFIWKPMKFLYKITARNVFRFKKRMLMMILGISGCTALVLTGFGVRDSVSNITDFQYDEIDTHDMELTFVNPISEGDIDELNERLGDDLDTMGLLNKTTVEHHSGDSVKTVYLCVSAEEELKDVMNFELLEGEINYPGGGQVMISRGLSEAAEVEAGDNIVFSDGNGKTVELQVSGVYENYVWHYGFITPETYEKYFDKEYKPNTIYMNLKESADPFEIGADVGEIDNVMNVMVVEEVKERIGNTMKMLDIVVWLVIGCAGALAFIVLFNLSNINITERVREIATIKVLGFYPRETGAYVFRENFVLAIMGIIVGLPLGALLHEFVMAQIKVDMFAMKVVIMPISYLLTVILVLLFLKVVDLVMRKKIDNIHMAESLKSVE